MSLPYDARVEYIESTGNNWIDSLVQAPSLASRIKIVAEAAYLGPTSGASYNHWCLFGAQNGGYFQLDKDGTVNQFRAHFTGQSAPLFTVLEETYRQKTEWMYDGIKCYVNGKLKATGKDGFTSNGTIGIFCRKMSNGNGDQYGQWRLYSMQFYLDGAMLRDFIPVRKGSTGYLYDRCSPSESASGNGLYAKKAGSNFVVGPDYFVPWGGGLQGISDKNASNGRD